MKTPNPEIFLEAAQILFEENGEFSCCCVGRVSQKWYGGVATESNARKWYERKIVCLKDGGRYAAFFDSLNERVLALLFAYQLALDEKGQFKMPKEKLARILNKIKSIPRHS